MTTAKKTTARLVAMATVLGALFTTAALHAQSAYCSTDTMNGTYVVQGTGTMVTPTGTMPFAVVGKVTYFGDGTGSVTASTINAGGTMSRINAPLPASYTVKPDCTGTKILAGIHYDFVISPNGRLITWIVTDAGVVLSGTAVKLDRAD